MKTLEQAWFMMRADLRGSKLRFLIMVVLTLGINFMLAYSLGLIVESLGTVPFTGSSRPTLDRLMADFMFLSLMPILGFFFSQRSLNYLSEDSYTRMLAYLTKLPVPAAAVMCRRKLEALLAFALNGFLYFGMMYGITDALWDIFSPSAYLAFALTWIGYGMVVNGGYMAIELLFSGKKYLGLSVLGVFFTMGGAAGIHLCGISLFDYSLTSSVKWGLASPVMWTWLLLGGLSIQLFSRLTLLKLKRRDLQ